MKLKNLKSRARKRGAALMMVLFLIVLLTIMVVAMLLTSMSETRSADNYASTIRTDELSEIAKSAVVMQIRRGTQFDPKERIAWASQPGAIRSYTDRGEFYRGFKLYSDSKMEVARNEEELATDAPPGDWDQYPDQYVDLNQPVRRTGSDGELHTFFPIFDPRAFYDDPSTDQDDRIEGFSYGEQLPGGGGGNLNGVVVDESDPNEWRCPMPVEWLYVLRDGTVGVLDSDNSFQPARKVSKENPIVGRIAFWTDDESNKININTASEPTYWATPTLGDRSDWAWAKMQPGAGEFQRFPGHPATTALSPVLFPNQMFADSATLNIRGRIDREDLSAARESADERGKIYDWAPKIQHIGSLGGTEFVNYREEKVGRHGKREVINYKHEYDQVAAAHERLYTSVDEYLLDPFRDEHQFDFTNFESDRRLHVSQKGDLYNLDSEQRLRQSRAFLTAHSRAPETTLFGTPRIAMWPLHANSDPDEGYRTHFDRLIARCSTLGEIDLDSQGDNSYYFRREQSQSSTHDVSINRNRQLLAYLQRLTSSPIPGYGHDFLSKYGKDRDQILIEVFDYIRSTNTHDATLASEAKDNSTKYKTYTAGRRGKPDRLVYGTSPTNFENGHGHVVPTWFEQWGVKGIGRALTIDEMAVHFICCADGTPNEVNQYRDDPNIDNPWKGGAAAWKRSAEGNPHDNSGFASRERKDPVYSNFPPNPRGTPYGPEDSGHPGYKSENWNYCLEDNEPLDTDWKRIQAVLLPDFFNPAPGYNPIMIRVGVRVTGLKNFKVNGETLFPEDEAEFWREGGSPNAHWSVKYGFRDKRVEERKPMPGDEEPIDEKDEFKDNLLVNEMVSNFIDVKGDTMTFGATGPIEVELMVQQKEDDPIEQLQTFTIRFPGPESVPTPNLVIDHGKGSYSYDRKKDPPPPPGWDPTKHGDWKRYKGPDLQAPNWWSFYRAGYNVQNHWKGRMDHINNWVYGDTYDVVFSMVPWHGDYRLVAASKHVAEDVFKPIAGTPDPNGEHGPEFGNWSFDHTVGSRNNALGHGETWRDDSNNEDRYSEYELAGLPWPNRSYGKHTTPHFPRTEEAMMISSRYGDFDIAMGSVMGGSFINKPDEGNLRHAARGTDGSGGIKRESWLREIPYFHNFWYGLESQDGFFSPNRMAPSPAIMGSLPSGVKAQEPWQTLLFRPDVNSQDQEGSPTEHPGAEDPPDHLLLDLFWMPVVEPYAISEPFSTAGKINLNYQILPFTNIRRATGMHGLLKGERLPSIPDNQTHHPRWGNFNRILEGDPSKRYRDDKIELNEQRWRGNYLYRPLDPDDTLKQFDEKFDEEHTLFRSASQICEMHLIPKVVDLPPNSEFSEGSFPDLDADTDRRMEDYWTAYRGTSDNLRERPYANLYSRATTQTNTWRMHYRVQRLKKSPQSESGVFDPDLDAVAGEQRGSMLIERYIDPNDPDLPDFTSDKDETLDTRYQFRVLSTKRFSM